MHVYYYKSFDFILLSHLTLDTNLLLLNQLEVKD